MASSIDNRIVDQMTVGAWQEAVGHLSYADCREALAMHRRESPEYLQPSHIVTNVKRLVADRYKGEGIAASTSDKSANKPANYLAMSKAWNDPDEFARQVAIYREQLRAEGYQGVMP